MPQPDYEYKIRIFANPGLGSWLSGNIKAASEVVTSEPESRISSENREVFINSVIGKYLVEMPKIDFDKITYTDYETKVNTGYYFGGIDRGRPGETTAEIVVYHLPYKGNLRILQYKPTEGLPWSLEVGVLGDALCFELPLLDNIDAVKRIKDENINSMMEQMDYLGNDIIIYNAGLREKVAKVYENRRERLLEKEAKLGALGVPRKPKKGISEVTPRINPKSETKTPGTTGIEQANKKKASNALSGYEVAFSFAGEDREYVNRVYEYLKGEGVPVFYDKDKDIEVEMWGEDLVEYLDNVFRKCSGYCVIFISKYYAEKVWPTLEKRSALARALTEKKKYILPARFDDTDLPGLQPTVKYFNLNEYEPEEFARLIIKKLGKEPKE